MKKKTLIAVAVLMCGICITACNPGNTQALAATTAYPVKDITMIVPFAAGGGTDLVARTLASVMGKNLGVNVVVENKPGGASLVGISEALSKPADGYTMSFMTDSLTISPYSSETYISLEKYTPLACIAITSPTLAISSKVPCKTFDEFLKYAKDNTGLRIGMSGSRGIWEVFVQQFENEAGLKFVHVPYDGGSQAILAVAGGHLECVMGAAQEMKSMIDAGNIRPLVVFGDERDVVLPDVPTGKEIGFNYSSDSFRGVIIQNGVDPAILKILDDAIAKAVKDPAFVEFMTNNGIMSNYLNSKEFAVMLAERDRQFADIFANW